MKTRISAFLFLSCLFSILSIAQPAAPASSSVDSRASAVKTGVAEQIRYADQFQWAQSPAGTIRASGAPAPITQFSITSNVVSFTATNTLTAGQTVLIADLKKGGFLNGTTLVISATGLSGSGFQAPFSHSNVEATAAAGTATLQNVVTMNSVRGIGAYSCAPPATGCGAKFAAFHTTHMLRIAGTGTPEVVKIAATTCTGAATGACTVTFAAAHPHAAGFTLGTATAGFMEALVDSYTQSTNNPATGRTIACSPYNESGHYIIYGTISIDDIAASGAGDTFLEGNGCVLEDGVAGGPMIRIDSDNKSGNVARVTMEHFGLTAARGLLGRTANGVTTMILDQSQGFHFLYNHFAYISNSDVVDTILQVSGDQQFTADHNDFENLPMLCDTTWCGPVIFGDSTANAALGDIHDNYFSSGQGTFIEWQSGNGLSIKDNVFQNWTKFPWRYSGGYQDMNDEGGNYYEGNCGAINPDFGVAGYACTTGPQYTGNHVYNAPNTNFGGMLVHRFSSTGKKLYSYYIVGNNAGGQQTKPFYIGDAASNGTTPFDILFLPFKAKTYDVLRAGPQVGDGTDASPYGTGNWAVAKGITCSTTHCTFRETFAAPLLYTVNSYQATTYTPSPYDVPYWPVPLFINSGGGTPKMYVGPAIGGLVTTDSNMSGVHFYDALFTSGNFQTGFLTGTRVLNLAPVQATSLPGNANPGAWLLNYNMQAAPMFNRKGRINMAASNGGFIAGTHDSCAYQGYDSNAMKTFATGGHQPLFDIGDTCMGFDTDPSYLAFQGGVHAISFYVNHVMDSGKSAVAQLLATGLSTRFGITSTMPTGTAPFTVTSTTPVAHLAATPTTYNSAGVQQANTHVVIGSCVLGASCAVKLLGASTFSEASSYNCTAQDRTAAAATRVVQASGSSFSITGTGSDTIGYSCIGN